MFDHVALEEIIVDRKSELKNNSVGSVAVAMIRNEGDIIAAWLSHVSACFDKVLVVDHQSTDGTFEILSDLATSSDKLWLYRFNNPGYYQAEVTNTIAWIAASCFPSAWIMPLDVDEFLFTGENETFLDVMADIGEDRIGYFPWKSCIPYDVTQDMEQDLNNPFMMAPTCSQYLKICFHAGAILNEGLQISQGNHEVRSPEGKQLSHDRYVSAGEMFHMPLRSLSQFVLKLLQGTIAYQSLPDSRRDPLQGFHWFRMARAIADFGHVSEGHLRDVALHYGEPEYGIIEDTSIYRMVDYGWSCGILPVNNKPLDVTAKRTKTHEENARDMLVEVSNSRQKEVFTAALTKKRRQVGGRKVSNSLSAESARFESLQGDSARRPSLDFPVSDIEFITDFIKPAFQSVENPVPSTWADNIPFIFCLLNYIRPRRFVELGTYYGNCFFAVCQFAKSFGIDMDCIAVDLWKGDEHTGDYGQGVFMDFREILKRDYPNQGRFIRKDFNSAVTQFEKGSIDLLHIDGLHTFEAVQNDYKTWRSMLSSCGVIMFHDTQVKERDFGVWRLWKQLCDEYPSFELKHGCGLGLIYVGESDDSSAAILFKRIAGLSIQIFLKEFFSKIGKLSPITES
ncbi:MAG: class I SAM-dependent methyltransferase [Spirochaetes bacterium]|nr:class I SAM-dependent methyltransferase [Spirochaetota bacterium]